MTSMPGYYLRKYVLEQQDEEIIVEEIIPVKYTTYEVTSFCYIFSGCFHDCISCIFNFDDLLYIYGSTLQTIQTSWSHQDSASLGLGWLLMVKNNSISLLWELNSFFFVNYLRKNSIVLTHNMLYWWWFHTHRWEYKTQWLWHSTVTWYTVPAINSGIR